MYNLLIGFAEGTAWGGRVVEYTKDAVESYVAPSGKVDPARLVNLPTMVMPELGDSTSRQIARVGHIEDLTRNGADYTFRFVANVDIGEIATDRIEAAAEALNIDDWEFNRTHWAVKDVDLYRVIGESITGARPTPRVFKFPTELPRDPYLVAVMMPFGKAFAPVYESIRTAVAEAGMVCRRADDIWISDHVMEDVIRLLWEARVVIADLSDKNPNVLYEAGIAHSLGRDTIQIAQSAGDIPFDLRGLRSVEYEASETGLVDLVSQISVRLSNLLASHGEPPSMSGGSA